MFSHAESIWLFFSVKCQLNKFLETGVTHTSLYLSEIFLNFNYNRCLTIYEPKILYSQTDYNSEIFSRCGLQNDQLFSVASVLSGNREQYMWTFIEIHQSVLA